MAFATAVNLKPLRGSVFWLNRADKKVLRRTNQHRVHKLLCSLTYDKGWFVLFLTQAFCLIFPIFIFPFPNLFFWRKKRSRKWKWKWKSPYKECCPWECWWFACILPPTTLMEPLWSPDDNIFQLQWWCSQQQTNKKRVKTPLWSPDGYLFSIASIYDCSQQ